MHDILLLIVPPPVALAEGPEKFDYETRLLRDADHHSVMPRADHADLFSFTVVVASPEGDDALAKRAAAWCAEQTAKGIEIRLQTIAHVRDERALLEAVRARFGGYWIEIVCDSTQEWKFRFHARGMFRARKALGVARYDVPVLKDDLRQVAELLMEEVLPRLYRRLPPSVKESIRRRRDDPRSWVNA